MVQTTKVLTSISQWVSPVNNKTVCPRVVLYIHIGDIHHDNYSINIVCCILLCRHTERYAIGYSLVRHTMVEQDTVLINTCMYACTHVHTHTFVHRYNSQADQQTYIVNK